MSQDDQKVADLALITIERIIFGVRFVPRYGVLDRVGEVIDAILRSEGSPFNPKVFPLSIRETGSHGLTNRETNDEITLTHDNAILNMQVKTRKISEIQTLADNFKIFVIDNLQKIARMESVNRYGILFVLEECHSILNMMPAERYLQTDFEDARSMSLRFTRRLPVMEALARKNVDDYRNVIYTINQTEKNDVGISIDYQEYFQPELNKNEISKKAYSDFVGRGNSYFLGEFQNWLGNIMKKSEAA